MIIIVRKFLTLFFGFWLFFCNLWGLELLELAPFDLKAIEKNPQDYLWSEKLDGIRAYWDGKNLYSKSGKKLNPPAFFTQGFPPFAIDGELWSKRGDFENIASIVKTAKNKDKWKELKLYVFEVPKQNGGLKERLEVLQTYLHQNQAPYIRIIPQNTFANSKELEKILEEVSSRGGEGLVLRDKNVAYYTNKRDKRAMKLKKFDDRECKILSYIQGKGKFENQVGAFICQDGSKKFKIGSGMSDEFRKSPPPIGTIITYKYFGLTKNKTPKYPSFLRIYETGEQNAGN